MKSDSLTPPIRDEEDTNLATTFVQAALMGLEISPQVEAELTSRLTAFVEMLQAEGPKVREEIIAAERARLRAFCLNLDRTTGKFPESDYEGLAVYSKYVGDPRGLDEKIEEWEEEMSRL